MADGYISQIKTPDNKVYDFRDQHLKVYTGSCSTAAGTNIKDVVTDGAFTLEKGAVIFVNFTATNTAEITELKLRVNSSAETDAKVIKHQYNGSESNLPGKGYIKANQTYIFYYNGTQWVMITDYNTDNNTLTRQQIDTARTGKYSLLQSYYTIGTATNTTARTTYRSDNIYTEPSSGTIFATLFNGSGASLISLNASNLSSGTVPVACLPLATTSTAGAVKIGSGISVSDGTISVTADNLGLTSALKYIGAKDSLPTETDSSTYSTYNNGDVITVSYKEYAYVKGSSASNSKWVELGDEGSYKLKQTAISAPAAETNKWVSSISQDADGVMAVSYSSLVTSGEWDGNAGTATALTSNAGGLEQPIYFSNGKPVATSYSLAASVGSGTANFLPKYTNANAIGKSSICNIPDIGYSTVTPNYTSGGEQYYKAWLTYICDNYSTANIYIGTATPNARGPILGNIYNVNDRDSSTNLPRYSTFWFNNLGGSLETFGTNNYNYYHRTYLTDNNYSSYTYALDGSNTGTKLQISTQSAAYTNGIQFMNNTTKKGNIGADNNGTIGIYGTKVVLRPQLDASTKGVEVTTDAMYPTASMTLGTDSKKWSTVYATIFDGNATTATTATNLANAPTLTETGTATIDLNANSTYTLSVGGQSIVFKTPADNNTATATDNILEGSNSGTAITYKPYTTQQNKLSFDISTTNPMLTDRLNLNGYLHATKLYSGNNEVLTIQTKSKALSSAGWYRILDCTTYSMAFFITFYGGYNHQPPTPVTFLVSHAYNTTRIEQIGRSGYVGWIKELRAVHHDTSKFYIDVYYGGNKENPCAFEITPLDPNARSNITLVDFTAITDSITANASCETTLESHADIADSADTASSAAKLTTARNLGVALDSTAAVTFDGSDNQTSIPISGTLGIANGGTGQTTLTAARQQFSGPEFIVGTWTAASGTWTGTTTDSELYDGKQIILYMPFAGSGNATLNLTLADGTTTGAKNVYFEGKNRFTTHKGQNAQLHLIYHSDLKLSDGITYEGWWYVANRDTDNDYRTRQKALANTDTSNRSLLLANPIVGTADNNTSYVTYRNDKIYANVNTGIVTATGFNGDLTGDVTGNADTATTALYMKSHDTREIIPTPTDLNAKTTGICFDFKEKGNVGIDYTNSPTYTGIMTYRSYGTGDDLSGGPVHQIAFNYDGLLWRKSISTTEWSDWHQVLVSGTTSVEKFYLLGTTSSFTDTTHTNTSLFAEDGALSAKSYGINAGTTANKVTLQWNSTDSSIDFIFA